MRKIKLYLDTSVISALDDRKKPNRMRETQLLWEDIKAGKYDIILSDVLFEEIRKCKLPKRDVLYNFIDEISYTHIQNNELIEDMAEEIIRLGILTAKSYDDCMHIGSGVYGECDCIVSWNFRHLVNYKTIKGVRIITSIFNYKNIEIMSPTMVIGREK
ncbi:MAG: PIN domain nuclease [Candidatus Cloacimonetes bacterium]|nr:PIN domain nuclease [Candidatus Cloacimonadota bacterium]